MEDYALMKAKTAFSTSNEQTLRSWRTADAFCQGPVLHSANACATF
jgi:hypothetical protein